MRRPWLHALLIAILGCASIRAQTGAAPATTDSLSSRKISRPAVDAPLVAPIDPESPSMQELIDRIERLEASRAKLVATQTKPDAPLLPSMKINGQLVIDALWFSQSPASRQQIGDVQDVFDFRRARLTTQGEYASLEYALGMDFALGTPTNGRPTFLDCYVGMKDVPLLQHIRIGHFFEPVSLDRNTSNRNLTFLERALPDAFAPARNIGVLTFGQNEDQSIYWAVGSFRSNTDNFSNDAGDSSGQSVDGRLAFRPYYDEASDGRYFMHIGSSFSYRHAADQITEYRSRPEVVGNADTLHAATPFFVETPIMASHESELFGQEFVVVHGSLSLQSEVIVAPVNRTNGNQDVLFYGAYVYASYFLTGEHRTYDRASATMDRIRPIHNFAPFATRNSNATGWGAWEVAARLSYLDLDDKDIHGGKLLDSTFGLNWYLSPYHRVKFNYILANLDRFQERNDSHIFGLRFDADF